MKRCFCTYFDHRYLARGVALYLSFKRFCPDFSLSILCLDSIVWEHLRRLQLPDVVLIRMEQLEERFPELISAKANRNLLEYYFTCTPALVSYVLVSNPEVNQVTYLDADLYLFSGLDAVFAEIGESSIAVVEHRYSAANQQREMESGRFNVSWVTFRRDSQALECLETWRRQCLDWCYDRVEGGLFGDQRYLDQWPERYSGLCIIQNPGVGCAPWNVDVAPWSHESGDVLIGGVPLCFFHFHGMRQVSDRVYDPVLAHYGTRLTPVLAENVYTPYVATLLALQQAIFGVDSERLVFDNLRREIYSGRGSEQLRSLSWIKKWVTVFGRIVMGEYILIWNIRGRVEQAKREIAHWIPTLHR